MDDSVKSFYNAWKKHYVLPSSRQGESYIYFEGTHGSNICVSEGQGYGMVIVALMAGFDSTAQETYDCLYRWYKSHPSTTSPNLMAWMQKMDCHQPRRRHRHRRRYGYRLFVAARRRPMGPS
jgi:endo-1,4-beta-D-glucanase Y